MNETNESRLKRIKDYVNHYDYLDYVNTSDLKWLIKQVEHFEKLVEHHDKFVNTAYDALKKEEEKVKGYKAENVKLREALEFYADEETWTESTHYYTADELGPNKHAGPPLIIEDNGEKARQALKSESK